MAKTRTQAIAAILRRLRVLDRVGNVSTTDATVIGDRYDDGIEELSNEDIITIADPTNGIPENAFLPLVDWLVEYCRHDFHQDLDIDAWARSRKHLRRIARLSYTVEDTGAGRLAARILRGLNYIGPDEAPSPLEAARMEEKINQAIIDLEQRRIIALGDADQVADLGAFDAFADYMVAVLRPEYGQDSQAGRLGPFSIIGRNDAERRLRSLAAPDPTYKPLVVSYF